MKILTLFEHETVRIKEAPAQEASQHIVTPRQARQLKGWDRASRKSDGTVFDWRDGQFATTHHVGVVQTSNLQIEVLPKIYNGHEKEDIKKTRKNLVYMLALSGSIPFKTRDLANVDTASGSVLEVLLAIFAKKMNTELTQCMDRGYVAQEENLRTLRGRIDMAKQVVHNACHQERLYCRFDAYCENTPLNKIFLWAAQTVGRRTRSVSTRLALSGCLERLSQVEPTAITERDFDEARAKPIDERFCDLFDFSRILYDGQASTLNNGAAGVFSLLFNMNVLFERFVAALCVKAVRMDRPHLEVYRQGHGQRQHLLQTKGRGVLLLKPDIVIKPRSTDAKQCWIIDTKWKKLPHHETKWSTPVVSDFYQIFAYATRYEAQSSVLLYPTFNDTGRIDYDIPMPSGKQRDIAVRTLDLKVDLSSSSGREMLLDRLRSIFKEVFDLRSSKLPQRR